MSHCAQSTKLSEAASIKNTPLTYLAIGDSYTIGESVSVEDRWPNQLASALSKKGIEISDVKIIARTGWTTANLSKAIQTENPVNHDLVSLLIGVNNQYQGLSFSEFNKEFDALLSTAIQLAHNKNDRVFVLSIPDYGLTPFVKNNQEKIANELDQYNSYMKAKCDQNGIPFIDITTVSRSLGASSGAIADDGLHPSGLQYSKWVDEILPVVTSLLVN